VTFDREQIWVPGFNVVRGDAHDTENTPQKDWAQGRINQLPCINNECWNKRARQDYQMKFPSVDFVVSSGNHLRKFLSSLRHRLHARQMTMEQVFHAYHIQIKEESRSYKIPWRNFDAHKLPKETEGGKGWTSSEARWETAYHGTRMEGLFSTICDGRLRPGPSRKLDKSGVFCFQKAKGHKACGHAVWMPLFEDGIFWRATWNSRWIEKIQIFRVRTAPTNA
jgi:hypothetical protein